VPDNQKLPSLEELNRSIKDAKKRLAGPARSSTTISAIGINMAWKICIELLAGIALGCFIGYYLDIWLHTKPFLFIFCFFLGAAGSGLNIFRMVQRDFKNNSNTPNE
jgi:ATP synthase protein I